LGCHPEAFDRKRCDPFAKNDCLLYICLF